MVVGFIVVGLQFGGYSEFGGFTLLLSRVPMEVYLAPLHEAAIFLNHTSSLLASTQPRVTSLLIQSPNVGNRDRVIVVVSTNSGRPHHNSRRPR